MSNAISDSLIREAIFDAMLILNINYMPTVSQLISIDEIEIELFGISKRGSWISNAINNRGGMRIWRKSLKLLTEKEYKAAINLSNLSNH